MKAFTIIVGAALPAVFVHASGVTPLGKVLEMLNDMSGKCKEAKHVEETEFAAYKTWCDGTKTSFTTSIAQSANQIEQLEADIAKAQSDAEELGAAASEELASADRMETEAKNATTIRQRESADYTATHEDLSESLDAIDRAKVVLQSRMADVPQSLLQLTKLNIPSEDKTAIEAFLSTSGAQAPRANAYEFQSGSILDLLDKLRLKFQDERLALQKAELAAKHNYEVLMQRLTSSIKQAKDTAAKKHAMKGERLEAASRSEGDKAVAFNSKSEDEKSLSETTAECIARSEEYEKNQVLRSQEIKAIEQAVEVLRSEAVSGNAEKHLPVGLVQSASHGVALAQLRGKEVSPSRQRAIQILSSQAQKLDSRYLSLVATHMADDPFAKVKKLIQDLIVKLSEEANSEADHHSFCTSELAMNKQTREDKQAEVEQLMAGVEKGTADGDRLATELVQLSGEVAELQRQRADATGMRKEEKTSNEKTVADAKEAQLAVGRAVQILKEFYASAAEGSLLQVSANANLTHGFAQKYHAPYHGMQTENGNVIGFLEVVLSDFARLEAETSSAEDESQRRYEKFMGESTQDLEVKQIEISHNERAKQHVESEVANLKKQLAFTQGELDAAVSYYEKLKPDCIDTGLSYEVRREKRREEIQSLQEALQALEQESSA